MQISRECVETTPQTPAARVILPHQKPVPQLYPQVRCLMLNTARIIVPAPHTHRIKETDSIRRTGNVGGSFCRMVDTNSSSHEE